LENSSNGAPHSICVSSLPETVDHVDGIDGILMAVGGDAFLFEPEIGPRFQQLTAKAIFQKLSR
jgi:hypothetical protein